MGQAVGRSECVDYATLTPMPSIDVRIKRGLKHIKLIVQF